MSLVYSKINPETASREEILKEIERLTQIRNDKENEEQAIKIFINSIYGACASPYFVGYNIKIAEAITLQGQDMIKFASDLFDRYFKTKWSKDKKLHSLMGITGPVTNCVGSVVAYGDTDSVAADTLIQTKFGDKTVEELYNEGFETAGETMKGHESVKTNVPMLNYSEDRDELYYEVPQRIIRHKVKKKRYKLTGGGNTVYVTGDHSLVVWRNGKMVETTAKEILPTDKLLIKKVEYNYEIVDIDECVEDGMFDDEYVYDIEMKENNTFFANNILVHNSVYITFEEPLATCNYEKNNPGKTGKDFIIELYKHRFNDYITHAFKIYGDKYGTENIQALELEKISESAIILAKKKYVLDLVWKEPDLHYAPQSKLNSKGVEIVQSSTPSFARKNLNELLKVLFKEKKNLDVKAFIQKMKSLKDEFKLCNLEDISKSTSIGDYEKFILQDQEKLSIGSHCPIHVRAAGVYNYTLNNSKWKKKYHLINSGDKVRWYHSVPTNKMDVFAYQPGNYPYELAPVVDFDMQFAKTMIEPINRFMIAMGYGPIPHNLISANRLF